MDRRYGIHARIRSSQPKAPAPTFRPPSPLVGATAPQPGCSPHLALRGLCCPECCPRPPHPNPLILPPITTTPTPLALSSGPTCPLLPRLPRCPPMPPPAPHPSHFSHTHHHAHAAGVLQRRLVHLRGAHLAQVLESTVQLGGALGTEWGGLQYLPAANSQTRAGPVQRTFVQRTSVQPSANCASRTNRDLYQAGD